MKLIYKSNPLSLVIEHYEPMSFEYDGWTISDQYDYNDKCPIDSEYKLVISSQEIESKNKLRENASHGRAITEIIINLLPYVALVSLNEPLNTNVFRTRQIINVAKPLKGWSCNYDEIETEFDKNDNSIIKVKCIQINSISWSKIPKSPLEELSVVIESYNGLPDSYKFLIFLYNSIKESEDKNRYMLIGKALEIINAIYPYEKHRGKDDDRIARFHPELTPIFGKITLKKLMEWSNNRQETRHYLGKGANAHPSLSEEERKQLYICTIYLITNIVRHKLGLDVITIKHDEVQI